jgi:hypothetical protein
LKHEQNFVVDLKHLGLVVSVAAAVAFRFFSDFSFATIQHQAALANLNIDELSPASLFSLTLNTLSYQLQRDWFNLTPQAPAEIVGVIIAFAMVYAMLRRSLVPAVAATSVMAAAPFVGIVATLGACAWVLSRAA